VPERNEEPVLNPVYLRPASAALRSLVFVAIAILFIIMLLPAALVAAAT
jgi:hypothetical protein